jgi:prepilin-type N-terminal cleavage/methylation domain-containing protein
MQNHAEPILRARRGFTLTELLAVVAIIVLLIGTLLVALNFGASRAQQAKTLFLMNSISSGLSQFEKDFGYMPPVLGRRDAAAGARGQGRDVVKYPQVSGSTDLEKQQLWYSYTTLAEYLVGYGHRGEDGYGVFRDVDGQSAAINTPGAAGAPGLREAPPFGIRSPGSDGCWGAIDSPQPAFSGNPNFRGYYRARNASFAAAPAAVTNGAAVNDAAFEGRVYGPYIDTIDDKLLGAITGFDPVSGEPIIVTADSGNNEFEELPKVILDYWGQPIAYYRQPYTNDDLRSTVADASGSYDLGDVFLLRPWTVRAGDNEEGAADLNNDTTSSVELRSATYALFSRGKDKQRDATRRRDPNEYNQDNLVVTGR